MTQQTHQPAVPEPGDGSPVPVEVRLIGPDAAVRTLTKALQDTAACGSVSYRPSRYSDGTRAYLTVVVPATN
jgi:hypothetical protein